MDPHLAGGPRRQRSIGGDLDAGFVASHQPEWPERRHDEAVAVDPALQ
jgi:hypothetical protein